MDLRPGLGTRRITRLVAIAAVTVLLTACLSRPRPQPFGNDAPRRERITELTYRGDCVGLLAEYRASQSDQEEDEMVYIDEHADGAGCFPEGSQGFTETEE